MGCTQIKNSRGKVIGFTCFFIQERGRFLLWSWEVHKYTGASWFFKYPKFAWNDYNNYLKRRRKNFSRWTVFKEDILQGFYDWFRVCEKHVLLGKYNPLWFWFHFQRWYRRKLKN